MSNGVEEGDFAQQDRLRGIVRSGRDLSPREVGIVERSIAANPDDWTSLKSRCRLLGYYMRRDHFSQRRSVGDLAYYDLVTDFHQRASESDLLTLCLLSRYAI